MLNTIYNHGNTRKDTEEKQDNTTVILANASIHLKQKHKRSNMDSGICQYDVHALLQTKSTPPPQMPVLPVKTNSCHGATREDTGKVIKEACLVFRPCFSVWFRGKINYLSLSF